MVTLIYFTTFLTSLVMTGSFLIRNKKIDSLFIFFGIMTILNSLGRYMVSVSDTMEMAVFSQKVLYIGACYCPVALIMIIFRLCDTKKPAIVKYGFPALATTVLAFVFTIDRNNYYYKSLKLVKGNGYSYLVKEYGPAHFLFSLLMILSGIFLILFTLYAIKNRNHMSLLVVSSMSILGFLVILSYLLERITHSNISYLSIGYLFACVIMIYLFERINMFDMSSNIATSVEKLGEYGYVIFDNKGRYISANTFMKETFPEIVTDWHVDARIAPNNSYLYTEIVDWILNKTDSKSHKIIHVGQKHFELSYRDISYNRSKNVGCILEMVDRTDEINYLNKIEHYNVDLEHEVELKTKDISYIKDMMVLGMASMVESRDNSTGGHIKRTSKVVEIFAKELMKHQHELNLTEDFLKLVTKAAPMHDLGKIAISDVILKKNGKFTDEEYNEMKRHSAEGAKIVTQILDGVENRDFVEIATNVAHFHHEKWDGSGYPTHISGASIPIEARIMALADVFDALVSKRCYKEAFSYEKAYSIITESLGSHFDPMLGKIFLNCKKDLETYYNAEA